MVESVLLLPQLNTSLGSAPEHASQALIEDE